jgi:hypothetical protein
MALRGAVAASYVNCPFKRTAAAGCCAAAFDGSYQDMRMQIHLTLLS